MVYRSSWFQVEGIHTGAMLGAFILKCLVGFGLLWLYGQFIRIDRSDADVFKFFDDAVVLQSSAQESIGRYWQLFMGDTSESLSSYFNRMFNWDSPREFFLFNDDRTIIRFHSLLLFVSGGNIRVHQVIFALISLLGSVLLFRGLNQWAPIKESGWGNKVGWAFWIICILPPSLLLWSSGLLKETLVMLPLGLVVYGLAYRGFGVRSWLSLTVGFTLFILIKPYVGICLLPGILFLSIDHCLSKGWTWAVFITGLLCFVFLVISTFIPSIDLIALMATEQAEFLALAQHETAGSIVVVQEFHDIPSFVAQSPMAVVRCLFRPGVWEMRGPLDALAAIENAVYILLILTALSFRRKQLPMRPILFGLITIFSLALLIGSVTPVLGAVVRYKVPLLPFLLFILLQVIDFDRIPFIRPRVTQ